MTRFSETLEKEAEPIWLRIFNHPFLHELSNGTLPLEKFRYYISQDHAFLTDFCRFLGLAIPRCESLEQIHYLSDVLHSEFTLEIDMQRELAEKVGLSVQEMQTTEASPTTRAYTSFLIRTAATGDIGEIFAALSPCPITYAEIAARLTQETGNVPAYAEWLQTYRSVEARELSERLRSFLDNISNTASHSQRLRMVRSFLTASRYEYLFWQMAYSMEKWTI